MIIFFPEVKRSQTKANLGKTFNLAIKEHFIARV